MRPLVPLFALVATLACSIEYAPRAKTQRRTPQDADRAEPRFDAPDEAARYFNSTRGIGTDFDLNAHYARARERITRMRAMSLGDGMPTRRIATRSAGSLLHGSWQFLGPGNIGGRTRALLIDPTDPLTLYAGAVSGGVWKTSNGGSSWASVGDWLPNLAVSSLAFDPADHRVLYAGTGEGYFREDVRGTALPIQGNGIFVSRDSGTTWQPLPSTAGEDFYWVNDLIVSPQDSSRLYAATRTGVWRSIDGGANWKRVLATTVKGGCLDLALRPGTGGDAMFAACGTFDQATVFRTMNGERDAPWVSVLSESGMGRTSLAVAPSQPSVVYALAASNVPGPNGDYEQGLFAIFRSDAGGDPGSWVAQVRNDSPSYLNTLLLTNLATAVNASCSGPAHGNFTNMGWHSNAIAVDPLDANRVWVAGVDLFRSDDGGRNWGVASYWWPQSDTPSFLHADQHSITFDPRYDGVANQRLLVTNDGGVYETSNSRAGIGTSLPDACTPLRSALIFRSLNHGFGATQFYHGAVAPDGQRYFGGAQDNGTVMGVDGSGVDAWSGLYGGDGGFVAIDPVDGTMFVEYQNANLARLRPSESRRLTPPSADAFLFISPFVLDPNQRQRLWLGGGRRLWRTEDQGTRGWLASSVLFPSQVSAVAVAPGMPDRVLAGLSDGVIARNDSATTTSASSIWLSSMPRAGFVSSITFEPSNPTIAYATYAKFGGSHVWRTLDAGVTWTVLDGSGAGTLPDLPVHSMAIDSANLYLGTDLGIFVSSDRGEHWQAESSFPRAITEALVLARGPRGRALYAFTHGRGAWRVDLTPETTRRRSAGR